MADVVVVQTKVVSGGGALWGDGQETVTFDAPTSVGNRVLVLYAALNTARTLTAITDDGVNTYNQITGAPWTTLGTARQVDIWRAPQTSAASGVTVTLSGTHSTQATVVLLEVSGLAADEVDDTSSGEGTLLSHASGSVDTTVADALLLGVTVGTTGSYTLDGSFTPLLDTSNLLVGYRDLDVQGTYSMTNTTAANEETLTVLAAFKAEADTGNINVPAGSLALTGSAPTASGPIAVAVLAGALGLVGAAPTVFSAQTVNIPAGSLSITGQYVAPTFQAPSAGHLAFTGHAPTISIVGGVTAGAGAVGFTGQAPSLAFSVAVPAGDLTVTGKAPTSIATAGVFMPAGSLTLSGAAPTTATTVAVPAGALSINGLAPSAGGTGQVTTGAGSVGLSGHAPSFAFGVGTGAGALTLSGAAPTISGALTAAPDAGSLQLSGHAPTLLVYVPTITAGAGSLTWTGYAPTTSQTSATSEPDVEIRVRADVSIIKVRA